MSDDFLYRDVPAFGKRVFRLGLATNYGIEGEDLKWALEQGINYVFWAPGSKKVTPMLKETLQHNRNSIILACAPTFGYTGKQIKRACQNFLEKLGTDYLDVFQILWLGRAGAWTRSTINALISLRESGMARNIGVSIHDRQRAGRLVEDSPLDMLMIRYNAAHTGAEQDIFPHLTKRKPAIVSYTATRWRALLKQPKEWNGPVMTAADCYRFCLSNPHIDLTLTGPKNRSQLEENLNILRQKGPLSEDEHQWMSEFGRVVHNESSRFTFRF